MKQKNPQSAKGSESAPTQLRIIGGSMRGRKLAYHGDPLTRPMKDRVREAVFNLIGKDVENKLAVDLFAGTGALAFEAISRKALGAVCIERHFPTAQIIVENARSLELEDQVRVVPGSAFVWGRKPDLPSDVPWLVFCSPPYEFYVSRQDEMLKLINTFVSAAPPASIFIVEADERFSMDLLPLYLDWDVRKYLPAFVAILKSES